MQSENLESPLCRDLRSKKFYFLDGMPLSAEDVLDASNHCWCHRTMQVVGPDGDLVHPHDCAAGRGCYGSQFGGR